MGDLTADAFFLLAFLFHFLSLILDIVVRTRGKLVIDHGLVDTHLFSFILQNEQKENISKPNNESVEIEIKLIELFCLRISFNNGRNPI